MSRDNFHWYAAYCMPGKEDRAKRYLEHRIVSMGMEDLFLNVFVPKREVNKWIGGKRSKLEECVYPGYLFIEMKMSPESFFVVKQCPSITGFANNTATDGVRSEPTPILKSEMDIILGVREKKAERPTNVFMPGDTVKIISGPFTDMTGSVFSSDDQRERVKVTLSFFGRETAVELSYPEVAKQ